MAVDYLLVTSGPQVGTRIHPGADLVIGRAVAGDGRLDGDAEISKRHARLTRRDAGVLLIEDLGSTNGTFVNGERITVPRRLDTSDVVRLGATTLEARSADMDVAVAGGTRGMATAAAATPRPSELDIGPAWEDVGWMPPTDPSPAAVPDDGPAVARPIEQAGSPSDLRGIPPMPGGPPPAAELIHEGRRLPVPAEGLAIGRATDNHVVLAAQTVSRHHARIVPAAGRHYLADLGSPNGTELNGELLQGSSRWLTSGDTITVAHQPLRFLEGQPTRLGVSAPEFAPRLVPYEGARLSIGRDPTNDVVLDDPNVSRFHAEVVPVDSGVELRDLDARNGTRLDGRLVRLGRLSPGSEIGVGPFRLVFDGTGFVQRDDRGALRLRADDLSVEAGGKTILNRASLAIEPGEFVVIIGESGSGKSTLIKALAGVTTPTDGAVAVNGEPVAMRLNDIGYVPQDDIVHRDLTVRESLRYSARLRLPRDSSDADIEAAVERVLEELQLEPHADTPIRSLSGGQRKRAGVATELLTRPSLLFLDEPTTGMDPGLETRMMELFRALAEQRRRALVVVTHATKNLALADKVVVMGRGGELAYCGSPEQAKGFFGAGDYDGIYRALDERPAVAWRRAYDATRRRRRAADDQAAEPAGLDVGAPAGARRRPQTGPQVGVLARRYLTLFTRDRRNLLILLGQAVAFGIAIALLFRAGLFDEAGRGRARDAALFVFLLVITVIWMGMVDGSREIIKERALFEREASVGVTLTAYLTSKALILFALLAVQTALLLAIVFAVRPAGAPVQGYASVLAILALTGFVAVAVGLLISSLAGSEDQATSYLPLALVPQLLFAGAIVSVKNMGQPMGAVSDVVFARWSYAGVGGALDMNERIAGDRRFARLNEFEQSFFALSEPVASLILIAFLALFLGGVVALLRRQGV